ncbi:MAG: SDR family NAD(P)-dependent oxidoreductase [Dongiaceae bacterium]
MRQPRTILITGASSGIGAALAEAYATAGIRLVLTGRDRARLDAVGARCRARGAETDTRIVDVADRASMAALIAECDAAAALDLVIANAGVSAGTLGGPEQGEQVRTLFAINVDGVVNTVQPAIEAMLPRGHGQIAIMSSLAALRGFPGAPTYCASKAAVKIWGEALRGALHHRGIAVNVICPGFIRTAMSAQNDFRMPLLMSAEKAAGIIQRGLARNRARIAFPWRLYAAVSLVASLPPGLIDPLLRRLPAKAGQIRD